MRGGRWCKWGFVAESPRPLWVTVSRGMQAVSLSVAIFNMSMDSTASPPNHTVSASTYLMVHFVSDVSFSTGWTSGTADDTAHGIVSTSPTCEGVSGVIFCTNDAAADLGIISRKAKDSAMGSIDKSVESPPNRTISASTYWTVHFDSSTFSTGRTSAVVQPTILHMAKSRPRQLVLEMRVSYSALMTQPQTGNQSKQLDSDWMLLTISETSGVIEIILFWKIFKFYRQNITWKVGELEKLFEMRVRYTTVKLILRTVTWYAKT